MSNRMEECYHDALDRVEKLEAALQDIKLYTMDPWAQKQAIRALEGKAELQWTENYGQGSEPWLKDDEK